jgi:hypothetical protein
MVTPVTIWVNDNCAQPGGHLLVHGARFALALCPAVHDDAAIYAASDPVSIATMHIGQTPGVTVCTITFTDPHVSADRMRQWW